MDNLTHTLTGLMLSRAGLHRFHPRATAILMIAANIPDLDGLTALAGAPVYFQYHRWITHALVMIPVVSLLPVLIVWLCRPKQKPYFLAGWLLSMIAVCSHLALDYTNPYGIRLFLPWDDSWPMLSITSVVDIWIWTILLIATFGPALGRLVSSEIGAKPNSGRAMAITALLLIAAYDVARWFMHERALAMLDNRMYNGESPVRVHAFPSPLSPTVWNGIVETGAFFVERTVRLVGPGSDEQGRVYFKPESSPAIEAAAKDPTFQRLRAFSKVLLWQSTPASDVEGGTRVSASDLYFGFTATAIVDSRNQVISSTFRF